MAHASIMNAQACVDDTLATLQAFKGAAQAATQDWVTQQQQQQADARAAANRT